MVIGYNKTGEAIEIDKKSFKQLNNFQNSDSEDSLDDITSVNS